MKFKYFFNLTAFSKAVEKRNTEIVRLLLSFDTLNINISSITEKKNENIEIIELTPLLYAIEQNQDEIIQLLLSNKLSENIDINKRSVKAIIRDESEIEIFEKTPLYISIEKRDIKAIQSLLIRTDIDINAKSFHFLGNDLVEQKAALHLAAEMGDLEIIKLLLEKKEIDINIEDGQGKKPIDYSENQEIKYLLSK